jgi:hypothetical protein
MSTRLLQRGKSLAQSGQTKEARKIFETLIQQDCYDDAAWREYISCLETRQEKVEALQEYVTLFPLDAPARARLIFMHEPAAPAPSPVVVEPSSAAEEKAQPVARPRTSLVPLLLFLVAACLLVAGAFSFVRSYNRLLGRVRELTAANQLAAANYDRLAQEYQALQAENVSLDGQYRALDAEFRSLLSRFDELGGAYTALQGSFDSLNNEHAILLGTYESLYADHSRLLEQYNILAGDYDRLESISIQPPYIFVHDRKVETTFYDVDGTLIYWSTPFSGLEYAIEAGSTTRSRMREDDWYKYIAYFEDGQSMEIPDFSVFIDPDPFDRVMPEIYQSSSDPREFIYRTWYIIGQLANYATEEQETPRYPYETLLAGGGDCEDLSILFASMIQAAPVNWEVDLVYIDSESPLYPVDPDHVLVYINTGQETFLVETTSDVEMLPYENGVTGWLGSQLHSNREQDLFPVYLR